MHTLDQGKAEDITIINLQGKSDIADYMVIATALADRHSVALADNILTSLRKEGYGNFEVEGRVPGHWVLVDALSVIVHIFAEETRQFYNLEKMWSA